MHQRYTGNGHSIAGNGSLCLPELHPIRDGLIVKFDIKTALSAEMEKFSIVTSELKRSGAGGAVRCHRPGFALGIRSTNRAIIEAMLRKA